MIDLAQYPIFTDNVETLKETSVDTSVTPVEYMTQSAHPAINFDKVKRVYINKLGLSEDNAASVDGILQGDSSIVFVEFKNGNMKDQKTRVARKAEESILMFCDIVTETLSVIRSDVDFILVYNESKNQHGPNHGRIQNSQSRTDIAQGIMRLAHEELIQFNLEKLKTFCFREVHTYTEKEFEVYMRRNTVHNVD